MKIFDTGISSATRNMAWDLCLLQHAARFSEPIMHCYDWARPSFTYGCFVDPAEFLDMEAVHMSGIDSARRCTGGGIIFHGYDFAFSILVPATHPCYSQDTLENYRCINTFVVEVINSFLGRQDASLLPEDYEAAGRGRFCLARPTKYDIFLDGKKVGGAAQRRTKDAFLHQGSISLAPFPIEEIKPLVLQQDVAVAMGMNSTSLVGDGVELSDVRETLLRFMMAMAE